ncbi:Hypothetical protein PBC10988_13040 [Planctomycetales bacterium 10988]|nr:Hypothetical protein PBC10988_13040 [Planctomycetales bacterium 10988]
MSNDNPFSSSSNPFETPASNFSPHAPGEAVPISPQIFTLDYVVQTTKEIYMERFAPVFFSTLIFWGVSFVGGLPAQFAQGLMNPELGIVKDEAGLLLMAALWFFFYIISLVINVWILAGHTKFLMQVVRGETENYGVIFSGPNFLSLLGTSLLYYLMLGFGMVFFILPGIFLFTALWPCIYLVIDDRTNTLGSFGTAWEYTEGNRLTVFLLALVMILVSLCGLLLCCIGVIFAFPAILLGYVVAYFAITGQPTFLDARK